MPVDEFMSLHEAEHLRRKAEDEILGIISDYQRLTGLQVPAITLEHNYTVGCSTGKVSGVKLHVEF